LQKKLFILRIAEKNLPSGQNMNAAVPSNSCSFLLVLVKTIDRIELNDLMTCTQCLELSKRTLFTQNFCMFHVVEGDLFLNVFVSFCLKFVFGYLPVSLAVSAIIFCYAGERNNVPTSTFKNKFALLCFHLLSCFSV